MLGTTSTVTGRLLRQSWPGAALSASAAVVTAQPSSVASPTCRIGLAEAIRAALELNCLRANRRDIRLHAYVVDQPVPTGEQRELSRKLETVVARTIASAVWGSAITCHVSVVADDIRVCLRFARPVANDCGGEDSIDLIDEIWSWRLATDQPGH